MTNKDRENYIKVLLALNGHKEESEKEDKEKWSVKRTVETANPLNYYGYDT